MINRSILHGSCAVMALTIATPAMPQVAAAPIPEQSAPTISAEVTPSADTSQSRLADIVVTAQRRSENTQKVPIAISVVSSETLTSANVTSLPNLSRLVPSIQIVQAAGATPIYFLRGVGSLSGNSLTDPAVSITYDGVPLARQYQGNGQFYDLERVEVLRGPQGTLYGRNATGGVISILPQAPILGENSAQASATYGNYNQFNADTAVNVALGDTAALRVSGMIAQHDGYLNDGEQDERTRSVRAQLLLRPNSDFSIKLGVDFEHLGGLGGGYALVDQSTFGAAYPAGTARITAADRVGYLSSRGQLYFSARGRGIPTDPVRPGYNNNFYGFNAQIQADLGFATLSVIPAYRRAELRYFAINSFSLDVAEKDDQYSLETRLSSKGTGPLQWIVGGFLLRDELKDHGNFDNFNGTGSRQDFTASTDSYAVFADATYRMTDAFRLLGGVRYTNDHKQASGLQTNLARTGGFIPLAGDQTFDSVNYRAGFQYDVAPRIMVYGTIATGFHSGGFYFSNILNPTDRNTYDPEKIKSYTIGAKTRLFDNKVQLNVEAFRWQLTGQQVSIFSLDGSGQIIFPTINAGRSLNQGVEVDLEVKPLRSTTLGAQVQYLDAKFEQLGYTQAIPVQPGFLCQTSGATPSLVINCNGMRPPQAPEWSINFRGDQSFDVGSGAEIVVGARAHYQSETIVGFNYLIDDVQAGVWTEDATLTFNAPGKKWSVGAFINNITDEVIKSNATHNGNVQAYQLRPPRTFGGRFSVKF